MNTINSIQGLQPTPVAGSGQGAGAGKTGATGFGEMLTKSIDAVNSQMQEADALAAGLVSGEHANIHETMIAAEKAGLSFRLMTKMQGKVVDAYKEVMRLQL